jgi:integrase
MSDATKPDCNPRFAQVCAESFARAEGLLIDDLPENTRRSYRQALRSWTLWHRIRYGGALALPVPSSVVQQFLLDFIAHPLKPRSAAGPWGCTLPKELDDMLVRARVKSALGPWSLSTVKMRLAALAAAHRWRGLQSPFDDVAVVRLLDTLRHQQQAARIQPRRTTAVTLGDVRRMIETCDDSLLGIRDRALIAFAFYYGGRQRAQLAATTVESFERVTNSQGQLSHIVWRDPSRPSRDMSSTIDSPVADYIDAWLTASGVRRGPMWRRIQNGRVTKGLSPHAFYRIIVRRARQAGLTGITGRSLRAGFVTAATESEMPLGTMMWLSGHRWGESVWRYHRPVTMESVLAACEQMDAALCSQSGAQR